jgi:hypothetical protein
LFALRLTYFFFFEVSVAILLVSGAILLIVSGAGAGAIADVSGDTDVVSLVSELLPLLLQAAKAAAIIAIAKNFFIFEILGLLTIDLVFIRFIAKGNPGF